MLHLGFHPRSEEQNNHHLFSQKRDNAMESNSTLTDPEKMSKINSIDLTLQQSGLRIGDVLNADASGDDDRKLLRKIDRL
jgi:hypothetical protein